MNKKATILDASVALDSYLATLLSEVPDEDWEEAATVDETPTIVSTPLTKRPEWADKPFKCLIFRVGQVQLMVPLADLASTHKFPEAEQLTKLPGLPKWTLGISPIQGQKIAVIDTARLIIKNNEKALPVSAMEYSKILILKDNKWGFGCDEIIETREIDPEDIRWRKSQAKADDNRPWLLGMLASELIGLMTLKTLLPIKK